MWHSIQKQTQIHADLPTAFYHLENSLNILEWLKYYLAVHRSFIVYNNRVCIHTDWCIPHAQTWRILLTEGWFRRPWYPCQESRIRSWFAKHERCENRYPKQLMFWYVPIHLTRSEVIPEPVNMSRPHKMLFEWVWNFNDHLSNALSYVAQELFPNYEKIYSCCQQVTGMQDGGGCCRRNGVLLGHSQQYNNWQPSPYTSVLDDLYF